MKSRQIVKRLSLDETNAAKGYRLLKDEEILQSGDMIFLKENNRFIYCGVVHGWRGCPVSNYAHFNKIHYKFYTKIK